MDELQLKKNEQGEVVQVVTTTNTEELTLDPAELRRQVEQFTSLAAKAQAQLDAVEDFAGSTDTERVVTL